MILVLLVGLVLGVIEICFKCIVLDYFYLVVVFVCLLIFVVFFVYVLIGLFGCMIGDGVVFVVCYLMIGSFVLIGVVLFGFLYVLLVIIGVY